MRHQKCFSKELNDRNKSEICRIRVPKGRCGEADHPVSVARDTPVVVQLADLTLITGEYQAMARKVVGKIDEKVINLLGVSVQPGTEIYLGDSNVTHMQKEHPTDFQQYFGQLEDVLFAPDYVALHPSNGSIEYIKVLADHVLVAIRVTSGGTWYARTLFAMSPQKVKKYMSNPNILKKC